MAGLLTRRSDSSRGEIDDGQAFQTGGLLEEMVGCLDVLCKCIQLLFIHGAGATDATHDRALVTDGLDNVAGAGLALGADERGTFGDAAESFAEITRAADEWDFEVVLVDVVVLVCGREDL